MVEYKKFKDECGIYCFTNKVNGKCYVGQGINLKKRLRAHYSTMRKQNVPNMIFYTAVAKYGIENFELEILEFLDPKLDQATLKKLLDDREKFYIKEKNSYVPNGYNQTLGGDAGVLGYKMTEEQKEKIRLGTQEQKEKAKKRIFARNLSEPKYYCNLTYEQASEKSGIYKNVIKDICNKSYLHPYAKGWTFAHDEITLFRNATEAFKSMANNTYATNSGLFKKGKMSQDVYAKIVRPVIEYDMNGNIIKEYPSVKSVVEELQCKQRTFSNFLNDSKRVSFHGRVFKFKFPPKKRNFSEEHLNKFKNSQRHIKAVSKYDLDDNLLESYNSVTEAALLNNADRKSIRSCCNGKRKTCKGFIWKFKLP